MTEEIKSGDNHSPDPEKKEPEPIKELKLSITKNLENGQLSVQGPGNGQMYDKWTCFGMMDDARDFIKAHNARISQSQIIKSNPSMAHQLRNMFHRR